MSRTHLLTIKDRVSQSSGTMATVRGEYSRQESLDLLGTSTAVGYTAVVEDMVGRQGWWVCRYIIGALNPRP